MGKNATHKTHKSLSRQEMGKFQWARPPNGDVKRVSLTEMPTIPFHNYGKSAVNKESCWNIPNVIV